MGVLRIILVADAPVAVLLQQPDIAVCTVLIMEIAVQMVHINLVKLYVVVADAVHLLAVVHLLPVHPEVILLIIIVLQLCVRV